VCLSFSATRTPPSYFHSARLFVEKHNSNITPIICEFTDFYDEKTIQTITPEVFGGLWYKVLSCAMELCPQTENTQAFLWIKLVWHSDLQYKIKVGRRYCINHLTNGIVYYE